MIENKKHQ